VPKQERAVATRRQIVHAAAEVFDREGFERASLAEIVNQAGITKGALYFHFKSKEDLAAVVIDEGHSISMNAAAAIGASGATALAQMVMLCYEMGREMVDDPIVRAGIRLTLEMSASIGPSTPYLDWINNCEQLVHTAVEQGDIVDTVDASALANFIVSGFTGIQLVSNVLTGRTDLDARIDQMLKIILPAIVPARRRSKLDQVRHARWEPATA
jgi:AcrR family transcriptional regulator